MRINASTVTMALLAGLLSASASFSQTPVTTNDYGVLEPVVAKKELYRADADAKKEIEEAVKLAVVEKKRVMLIFGGNWCYDCHVLDRALHEGAAGKIVKESFLLVHVDIGEGEKNPDLLKLYKIPLAKGVPAVAILTGEGKLIYSSGEGEFEAARRMMKKDLVAFLLSWKERTH
jgi:thioredoxin-related protein